MKFPNIKIKICFEGKRDDGTKNTINNTLRKDEKHSNKLAELNVSESKTCMSRDKTKTTTELLYQFAKKLKFEFEKRRIHNEEKFTQHESLALN